MNANPNKSNLSEKLNLTTRATRLLLFFYGFNCEKMVLILLKAPFEKEIRM